MHSETTQRVTANLGEADRQESTEATRRRKANADTKSGRRRWQQVHVGTRGEPHSEGRQAWRTSTTNWHYIPSKHQSIQNPLGCRGWSEGLGPCHTQSCTWVLHNNVPRPLVLVVALLADGKDLYATLLQSGGDGSAEGARGLYHSSAADATCFSQQRNKQCLTADQKNQVSIKGEKHWVLF